MREQLTPGYILAKLSTLEAEGDDGWDFIETLSGVDDEATEHLLDDGGQDGFVMEDGTVFLSDVNGHWRIAD